MTGIAHQEGTTGTVSRRAPLTADSGVRFAQGSHTVASCLVAAERVRRNKKAHPECLKFVQGK
jgi:hypothetical protein